MDLSNHPDETRAERLERRRRRADRGDAEPVSSPDPVEGSDPAESELRERRRRRERAPAPEETVAAADPGTGADIVTFRRRRERPSRATEEGGAEPLPLPVPQVGASRLLARLQEMREAASHAPAARLAAGGRGVLLSFLAIVLVPALAITLYLYAWASDQYHAEIRFAVRNAQVPASSSASTGLLIASGNPTASLPDLADSYVVLEYLQSREFVEDLHERIDLHSIYGVETADVWYRMPADISIERMVDYVLGMMRVTFDMYTGIVSVNVRAFSAADAKSVGDQTLGMAEALVNKISERARRELVSASEVEVQRAEARLRLARAAIAKFRVDEQAVDPNQVATAQQVNISALETELTKLKAELKQLTQTMTAAAPRVRVQQSRVEALERQIEDEKTKVALRSRAGEAISAQLARYEELVTERDFAQAAYVASLNTLERSRIEAERNQRYLALIVSPRPAQDSEYPERFRYSFLSALGLFALWAVAVMVLGSIRDHIQ